MRVNCKLIYTIRLYIIKCKKTSVYQDNIKFDTNILTLLQAVRMVDKTFN